MDLLGSILNSMDKPPAANEEKKEQMKSKEQIIFSSFAIPGSADFYLPLVYF